MKTTVSIHDFRDGIQSIRPNNFSHAGLGTLFEILTDLEGEGIELEFDPIGFCCEFSEYTEKDLREYYSETIADAGSFESFLEEHPIWAVNSESTFIIQDF
jgi:hypothetical protein